MERRVITTEKQKEDVAPENSLRPKYLSEYIGQSKIKKSLSIYIQAAKDRGEPLDHVLFYGPPGLGKTTLSGIIANEMGVRVKITSGPAIATPGDMAAIIMGLMIGKGPTAKSTRIAVPHFTLVGATTRAGLLSAPLRDRFGVIFHMEYYTPEELKTIILASAKKLGVDIDENGAYEMAKRSRGTPRLANRLLRRVRDIAQVRFDGQITEEVAAKSLDLLEVDSMGLDKTDRKILTSIRDAFGGGPVGLETLAAYVGEDKGTIEDVTEPYLVQTGLIVRTPKGRQLTQKAYDHLKNKL